MAAGAEGGVAREMVELGAVAERLRRYLELVHASNMFSAIGMALSGYWLVVYSLFIHLDLTASLHAWLAALAANFALAVAVTWLLALVSPGVSKRAWPRRSALAAAPFVALYAVPYPTPALYAVAWVPALGLFHLILYALQRGMPHSRLFLLSAALILLCSPAPAAMALGGDPLAAPLLGLGIVLLSYFTSVLYGLRLARGWLWVGG